MSGPAPELARKQRWLQGAITERAGDENVEDLLTASATQSAGERLAIYQRSYLVRLLECLRAVFPALQHALGAALFDRFAADYLECHPPAGPTLTHLADGFPAHLAATRPDADRAPEDREPWADFLIEVATLELALPEVYDGPGLEGVALPAVDDVVSLPSAELHAARFAPSPSLRLFAFRFPVAAYVTAVHRGESPPLPGPAPTPLAVCRRDFRVRLHPLYEGQPDLLAALDGTRTLGEALATLPAGEPIDPVVLRGWLRAWLDEWLFARVELAKTLPSSQLDGGRRRRYGSVEEPSCHR